MAPKATRRSIEYVLFARANLDPTHIDPAHIDPALIDAALIDPAPIERAPIDGRIIARSMIARSHPGCSMLRLASRVVLALCLGSIAVGCVPQIGQRPAADSGSTGSAATAGNASGQGVDSVSPGSGSQPAFEQVPAQAGVGIKGRSLDEHEGALVTPAKTLFKVRERVVFEIQIPQAMALFQASEGNYPATHDEFMERIVNANNIKLPALPEQHVYVYDPESHELLVRRPAAAAPSGNPK